MKQLNRFIAVAFIVAAALSAVRAEHFSIKTADGYLHVYNSEKYSFTIEIKGRKIEPSQVHGNPSFRIDGEIVQLLVVNRENFDPGKKSSGADILAKHRDWELDYLKQIFETVPKAASRSLTIAGRDHLIWGYTRPTHVVEFDRDHFITTVVGDDVVGLNSPVVIDRSIDGYEKRFAEIMTSMGISKTPYDVEKLADEIRKGKSTAK